MATPKFYVKASSYSNINPYPTWKRDADYWEKDLSNNLFYMAGNIGIGYPIPAGGLVVTTTIGIGTSAPQAALDVSGGLLVSGNTSIGGTITTSSTITGTILISNIASGTAPLTLTSSTLVQNLNADLLDGLNSDKFMRTDTNTSTTGNMTISGNVGIGTTNAQAKVHIQDTGAMIIPAGTTAQQPSTPVLGMVRFNTDTNRLQFYNVSGWNSIGGVNATGGNSIYDTNGYRVHIFTSSQDFVLISGGEIEYLLIAGGGGGGRDSYVDERGAGGGGAGGYITSILTLAPNPYTVVIGAGGAGATSVIGTNGNNSVFNTVTATGGGGGGGHGNLNTPYPGTNQAGQSGGSGGGGSNNVAGAAGITGQGFAGGTGQNTGAPFGGGGGGGAGGVGTGGSLMTGGIGITSVISGTSVSRGGGGGGRGGPPSTNGSATAGGGAGGGFSGTANTGGGGGANRNANGGSGGSGTVIIRYKL